VTIAIVTGCLLLAGFPLFPLNFTGKAYSDRPEIQKNT
jgi:hypothetical protein